jgi:hypothetical protein
MSASLEAKIDALIETLNKTVGAGPSRAGAPTGNDNLGAKIAGFANAFVDSSAKLMTGTYSVSAGMSDVSKTLGAAGGPLVGAITGILSKVGTEFIGINKILNDVGGSGVNFGNNLGKFTESVVSARMSLPEFSRIIAENGSRIAGLSGNAQKSSEVFLAIGKDFAESPAVRQLNAAGVGMEELNKVLTISALNRRNLDMNDANAQRRVAQAAADMATEMDNVARLTGVSRQQQEKQIQDQMKKAEVEIMIAAMSEQERDAYEKNTTALGKYGKEFQDVLTIYSTGGVRNAEDNAKVAAMGPKFAGLLEEMSKIKGNTAEDNERRRKIQAEIDEEALRISKDPEELKSRASLATSAGEYGRAQAEVTRAVLRYGALLQNAERDIETENAKRVANKQERITLEQMIDQQVKEEAAKRKAALESTEPGAIINRTEMLIKDVSAGAAKGFDSLNTSVKESFDGFKGLNETLKPFTKEDVVRKFKDFLSTINPSVVDGSKLTGKAKEEYDRLKKDGKAEGGGMFGNRPYLVGEDGPEIGSFNKDSNLLSNKNLRSLFGESDTDLKNATSNLQAEMRSKIADLKSSTLTADQLEQAMSRVTASIPKQLPQVPQDNTASNELIAHVKQLNTNVRELITAVVDGSSANVKAVRTSGGNMIA